VKVRNSLANNDWVLGSANLGMKYGVANDSKPTRNQSRKIIIEAIRNGVVKFDTAPVYGEAENILGESLEGLLSAQVITKISETRQDNFEGIVESIKKSLEKTKQQRLYGLLFHDPEIVKSRQFQSLVWRLQDTDLVSKIGISGYNEVDILRAKEKCDELSLFQVPENILDRRLRESTGLQEIALSGSEIHVRSVFLQGMLLMDPYKIKGILKPWESAINELNKFASSLGVSVIDICISYVKSLKWSSGTVIAASSASNLLDIIQSDSSIECDFDYLPKLPEKLIDPRKWNN
jgi:aryl-alcohol dehydrogenase-like predicted oxidoreductase